MKRLCLLLLLLMAPLAGQEATAAVGHIRALAESGSSYTWMIQYRHNLSEHWAASLAWINEGHFDNHHRDGYSLQAWWMMPVGDEGMRVEVGAGTYRAFDTTTEDGSSPRHYLNTHGHHPILSLRLQRPITPKLSAFLQANRTMGSGELQTQSILLGLSARLRTPTTPHEIAARKAADAQRNELSVFAGRVILNSFQSQSGTSWAMEYRRVLPKPFECTLSYCSEGSQARVSREGLALQLWACAHSGPWALRFGGGPYYSQVATRHGTHMQTNARVDLDLARRLHPAWTCHLRWARTVTHNNRDTDLIMLGVGYGW